MTAIQYLLAIVAATFVHAAFLGFAIKLMVEIKVGYGHAWRIVAAEYVAAGAVILLIHLGNLAGQTAMISLAAIVLVFVGATIIGRTVAFANNDRLGIGNGVLIQFMQVPLILPFIIISSFLFDAGK
jgi:hypothetical protein